MELRDVLQKRAEQNLSKLLCLNDKCISLNIIYIGYPNENKEPRDQYDDKCIEFIFTEMEEKQNILHCTC